MKFTWLGHSCFTVHTAQGSITLDPYADNYVPGYGTVRPVTDAVFCSHGHNDHGNTAAVTLTGAPFEVGVQTLSTWHDEVQGAKRGPNTIHIFSAEGMRVAHLGDLGCELDAEQAAALAGVDVLLIPVGGFYTIDAAQAAATVDQLSPRIVVPMHYKGESFGYDVLSGVEDFLALCKRPVARLEGNSFEVTPDTTAQIIVPAYCPD